MGFAGETRKDARARAHWKRILFRALYERGYGRDDVVELFRFLDWVLRLPEDLERAFTQDVEAFEEESTIWRALCLARSRSAGPGRWPPVNQTAEPNAGSMCMAA